MATSTPTTLSDLDGTDDAADWLTAGHVLEQSEVDFLRSLRLATSEPELIERDTPLLTVGDISHFFLHTIHANGLGHQLRTAVDRGEARSRALGALEQLSANVKADSERHWELQAEHRDLLQQRQAVREFLGTAK